MRILFLMCVSVLLIATGCKKEKGCLDTTACNFSATAQVSDNSCVYAPGCMNSSADNYNSLACNDDGSCTYSGVRSYWTSSSAYGDISVWVDGVYIGTLTSFWPVGGPVCGSGTTAGHIKHTLSLPTSASVSHHITASGSVSGTWDTWRLYSSVSCFEVEFI